MSTDLSDTELDYYDDNDEHNNYMEKGSNLKLIKSNNVDKEKRKQQELLKQEKTKQQQQ